MLFNSLEFLLFLPIVFAAYWILNMWTERRQMLRLQNLLLLVASYVFYGWWDWRFLSLIAFSTAVDYAVGLQIAKGNQQELAANAPEEARSRTAKRWLWVSLAVNLGLLGYFKYANFFIENWIDAWAAAGVRLNPWSLKVILPVGISFYTFHTLSYSIDIYRRKLESTRNFIEFAAFVSFFQLLVAKIEKFWRILIYTLLSEYVHPLKKQQNSRFTLQNLSREILYLQFDFARPLTHA